MYSYSLVVYTVLSLSWLFCPYSITVESAYLIDYASATVREDLSLVEIAWAYLEKTSVFINTFSFPSAEGSVFPTELDLICGGVVSGLCKSVYY